MVVISAVGISHFSRPYMPNVVNPVFDRGVRFRVERIVGIDELQSWVVDILAQDPEDVLIADTGEVKPQFLTDDVRALVPHPWCISVWHPNGGSDDGFVFITWGGGFHHWRVYVGPPTFTVENWVEGKGWFNRWQEGVYGWQE